MTKSSMFFRLTPFRIFLGIVCTLIVGSLFRYSNQPVEHTYSSFIRALSQNQVKSVHIQGQKINIMYKDNTYAIAYGSRYEGPIIEKVLTRPDITLTVEPYRDYATAYIIFNSIIHLIFIAFIIYMNMMRNNPFLTSRESKSKQKNVSFDDIAGLSGQKRELLKIVKIMQNAKIFMDMGAKIPKGVLLLGPPGTGKTLLARALATETKTSFLYASGSQFLEMFVGVGPSRIRELFKRAESQKPCIIFIDEIDSIGGKRGSIGRDGAMNERENTLNQLLIEMDGFQQKSGVLVIAATNRADVLDDALLRPGRFDIQVNIPMPVSHERLETFKLYLRKCKVHPDGVNLKNVIRETAQMPTSAIETIVNRAAINAAVRHIDSTGNTTKNTESEEKNESTTINTEQDMQSETLNNIVDYIKLNKDKPDTKNNKANLSGINQNDMDKAAHEFLMGIYSEQQFTYEIRKRTAYHEAGHAIIAHYLDSDLIKEATIIPTDKALGMVKLLPKDDDPVSYSRSWYENRIAVLLGGIKAEEILYGKSEVSSGAVSDLKYVTSIARQMVMYFAMHNDTNEDTNDNLSYMQYLPEAYSHDLRGPETKNMCDKAVRNLINKIAKKVDAMFVEYDLQWRKIAETLLELHTLTGKQLGVVVENHELSIEEIQKKFPNEIGPVEADDEMYIYKPIEA